MGKTIHLTLPVVTRWGSHYTAISQLLQTRRPMELLCLEKAEELVQSVGATPAAKQKAEKILKLVRRDDMWESLESVLAHLGPILVGMPLHACSHCCNSSGMALYVSAHA